MNILAVFVSTAATAAPIPCPCANATLAATAAWCNVSLGIDRRVDDLASRLSLEELLQQLGGPSLPPIPRLGISGFNFAMECLAGLGAVNVSTSWPMPIALAASFDAELVEEVSSAMADEARGHYNAAGGKTGSPVPPYSPGVYPVCLVSLFIF